MATLRLYLDVRNRSDRAPIKIAVNHKGKTAFIPTNVYISEEQWDKTLQRITSKQAKWHGLTANKMLMEAEEALYKLQYEGKIHNVNVTELRDMIVSTMHGDESNKVLFIDYYKKILNTKTNLNTKKIYAYALERLKHLIPNVGAMTFDDFTKNTIREILNSNQSVNTKLNILKCVSNVFNEAIDNNITTNYPMRKLNIKRPVTKKRDLSVEELRNIFNHSTFGCDMFKLSFLLCGMNPIDMFYCAYPTNGRVEYNRHKTGRFYSIKVEPEAQAIIDKYTDENKLLNLDCSFTLFVGRCWNSLKKVDPKLSMYWARHSWATIAFNIGISKDVISLALGHANGSNITSIYINPNIKLIDKANREVIDYIFKGE